MSVGAERGAVPGDRIGSYIIESALGEGGMGAVYLARSRGGRAVAVKVAKSELAADPGFRERFRAEVAAARAVGGFHTAQVVDADPDAQVPWLATAYVPGPTLSARIDAQGPMNAGHLTALGAALAEALQAIHRCGLVHRDLKPGNIIMAEDGPRVLDFGIARAVESTRMTATGYAFGTPGFLAPEQALGEEVTGAADVFALGAVLVAAAGGTAFGAGTPMGQMYRSVHEPPDLSTVPEAIREVAAACLAKDPAERPGPERLLDWFDELEGRASARTDPRAALQMSPPPPYVPTRPSLPPPPVPLHPPSVPPSVPGPVADLHSEAFIATDSDSSIVIDAEGVQLVLNGRGLPLDEIETDADLDRVGVEADFTWSEIATVTFHTVRRTRLVIVVTLRDGSAYDCQINARRSARLAEWQAGITYSLSRYLHHPFPQ